MMKKAIATMVILMAVAATVFAADYKITGDIPNDDQLYAEANDCVVGFYALEQQFNRYVQLKRKSFAKTMHFSKKELKKLWVDAPYAKDLANLTFAVLKDWANAHVAVEPVDWWVSTGIIPPSDCEYVDVWLVDYKGDKDFTAYINYK